MGGNDTGRRDAYSYERSPEKAPILRISYDAGDLTEIEGCTEKTLVYRVNSPNDDAEEKDGSGSRTWSTDLEMFKDGDKDQAIGVRFVNVDLPKNAEVIDARITFADDGGSYGHVSGKIYGQAADNAGRFHDGGTNITSRSKITSEMVEWNNIPEDPDDDKWTTPNISGIVEAITNRGGWVKGNAMVFILENAGSSGKRDAKAYESSASNAPVLQIKYLERSTEELVIEESIDARDANVDFGTHRGDGTTPKHRVSHPLSYTGGMVEREDSCKDSNLNEWSCRSEIVTGSPTYKSPIQSECQTNHIVLLSDGEALSTSPVAKVKALTSVADCTGHSTLDEKCGVELVRWLADTDHAGYTGVQPIRTHTIGFNLSSDFLKNLSTIHGDGSYYRADSASELVSSFESILAGVDSIETSFVAPGATVNQFNRLTHRNDIYFALFKPQSRPNWAGNLKKYQVAINSDNNVVIQDFSTPPKNAVNSDEGFFDVEAKSDWSRVVDGRDVSLGGAAGQQSHFYTVDGTGSDRRQLYTYLGDLDSIPSDGVDIRADGALIHESNGDISAADVGASGSASSVGGVLADRDNLLRWVRGVDVKNEDNDYDEFDDPIVNEMRDHMGDPMHSRPVIVNYANGAADPHTTIYFGTNEGMLHAINSNDGREVFSFMPKVLMSNVANSFENSTADSHFYGLDGPVTTLIDDINGNVMIDSGESAMLYVGMRRGGSNYYAFDVSNRENPILAWAIQGGPGGTPGFEDLGQSWSRMVPTKVRINDEIKDVVIFAGGYDASNDIDYTIGQQPKVHDSVGNIIYIVDAHSGELVYSIGGSDTSSSQKFTDMNYSIPSDIRVLDIDGNGFGDALFVGDLGGQLWRFDFNLYHSSGDGDLVQGGVIAALSGTGTTLSEQRRFFYEPDVVLIRENGERFLTIALGSGWRSHPLNTTINDRFYMIRSNDVYKMPQGYGKSDGTGGWEPLTEADLTDVTNSIGAIINNYGWMLKLERAGEKVLGDALTVNNQVIFTSYLPEAQVDDCSTALGAGRVYAMRVSNAAASLDLDNDGNKTTDDRSTELSHAGVPPEATALIVEGDNGKIKPTILVGPEQPIKGVFSDNLTTRTFWIDAGMTRHGVRAAADKANSTQEGSDSNASDSGTTDQASDPQTQASTE